MSKYVFIQEDEQFGKRTFEFRATDLAQMLDQYRDFLLAAGFVIDSKDCIDVVPFSEACVKEGSVVIDWSEQ